MSCSLDFRRLSTWENADPIRVCKRISSDEESENCNPGAVQVSTHVFKMIKDKKERAQFFLNCENLGLRGWKLFFAYKNCCQEDYDKFIQCVLNSDEVMMNALKKIEKEKL